MADVFSYQNLFLRKCQGVNDNVDFNFYQTFNYYRTRFYIQKILGTPLF